MTIELFKSVPLPPRSRTNWAYENADPNGSKANPVVNMHSCEPPYSIEAEVERPLIARQALPKITDLLLGVLDVGHVPLPLAAGR